ncbi:hypothetical protein NMS_1890 [Nonlabens marinus S1-08]|uniref:Uncharacterized protein n=1 Tax=Nonlabens marinus S1-08 TaxID=1454201 RepID=W8VQU2_9FLAO|nr:hypothetical protein NMS_1890 [Nonlabens marinus S1-08]
MRPKTPRRSHFKIVFKRIGFGLKLRHKKICREWIAADFIILFRLTSPV